MPAPLVAPLERNCLVCLLPEPVRELANVAIWDGGMVRTLGYRASAVRVIEAQTGRKLDPKTIARHADHIEASWHPASLKGAAPPAAPNEVTVFPIDYMGVVDRAAQLGMQAMERLSKAMPTLDGRELVAVAKMGVTAVTERERAANDKNRPQLTMQVLFGVASGHLEVPEGEVIDVTPVEELRAEVEAERAALQLAAGYE